MRKLCFLALLAGCGPISLSADANWGANGNQKFKKTIEVEQSQTDAQTQSQTDIAEAIIKILPFLTPAPTPTPVPVNRVQRVIIEMVPTSTPTPWQIPPRPVVKKAKVVSKPKCPPGCKSTDCICE